MRSLIKTVSNAALVVGGFFLVLFGTSKMSNQSAPRDMLQLEGFDGIAHADVPYSEAAYYGQGSYGGDSGDCGDCGDCGK